MEHDKAFKLCITMAGAVSAGAYTAGVLDYLLETMELWQAAKDKNRSLGIDHPDYNHSIPMHDVEIDVISGSSAGGICGTLAFLAMVDKDYRSYNAKNPKGENNIFYQSWVEMADDSDSTTVDKLLQDDDIKNEKQVKSLLNTKPIDVIADKALSIKTISDARPYASKSLDVVLTTTNLRGLKYNISFDNDSTIITNHAGFLRYKHKNEQFPPGIPTNKNELYFVLDIQEKKHLQYLKDATLSTAAFPIGLRSRKLSVSTEFIKRYPRYLFNTANGVEPIVPDSATYDFNSVDGGLINNEPYGMGVKILKEKNPVHFEEKQYAVLMVDPFPNRDNDDSDIGEGLVDIAKGMFRSLRNQVMFNQDGFLEALDTSNLTKFLIAPERKVERNGTWERAKSDLASAPIGGFAGFLHRDFREHDFQLGRYNCQAFLRFYFGIPETDVKGRLKWSANEATLDRFGYWFPHNSPDKKLFFPIIPDMRVLENRTEKVDVATYGADAKIKLHPFPKMSIKEFDRRYKKKVKNRIGMVTRNLTKYRFLVNLANFFYVKRAGYRFIKNSLEDELGNNELLQ